MQAEFEGFSAAFFYDDDKREKIDTGGKIILPYSALNQILSLGLDNQMIFRITAGNGRVTHGGSCEFFQQEGKVILPFWMFQTLEKSVGDRFYVQLCRLPPGKHLKLRAQSSEFAQLPDERIILEHELREYPALTKGDVISILFNRTQYAIEVLSVESREGVCNAIHTTDQDVTLEFDAPSDVPLTPVSQRIEELDTDSDVEMVEEGEEASGLNDFTAFGGMARRLESDPHRPPFVESVSVGEKKKRKKTPKKDVLPKLSDFKNIAPSGKYVFGRSVYETGEDEKSKSGDAHDKDESNFVAFAGEGRKLE